MFIGVRKVELEDYTHATHIIGNDGGFPSLVLRVIFFGPDMNGNAVTCD